MTRAPLHVALVIVLAACIDTDLSLGRHDAPASGDGDGDQAPRDMDATFVPAPVSGGAGGMPSGTTGGAPYMPPPDAGPERDADTPLPAVSPCAERVTMTATLACEIPEGAFGGPPGSRPPPMITTTVLVFEPPRPGQSFARATAPLAFEAWNATFTGRIDGNLDCVRNLFSAVIQEGEVSMVDTLPGPFFGRIDGRMEPETFVIRGPWWHGPDPGTPVCIGDWTAAPR